MSVIVPTYNSATLARAVDSVVGQTFGAWELLVVDDASDDDVEGRIAARGDDPRIRVIRRHVNGGVAAAQNTGIDHARGDFVVFLHSDDVLLPEKLGRQVDLLTGAGDAVGAVESGIEVAWPDRVERWAPALDTATAFDLLAYRTRVHISGLMIRRDLAAQLRFDERLRGAEDRDFCIRLVRTTDVVCAPAALSRVSKSGTRLSHQNKGPIYAYLLDKYHDDIAADRRVHADWNYRVARAFARAGQMPEAREALRTSVRLRPAHAQRWPLWLASFGGDRITSAAFRAQVQGAELAHRARRR